LRDDSKYKAYIFSGFDGTILSNNASIPMPWHELHVDTASIQQLPKYLRRFPGDYSRLQRMAFTLYLAVRFPGRFREVVAGKLRKRSKPAPER
jgi:hypothetical protein